MWNLKYKYKIYFLNKKIYLNKKKYLEEIT